MARTALQCDCAGGCTFLGDSRSSLPPQHGARVVLDDLEALPGFTLLSTLLSLVLIRIVIVTALSYGLSQLALEMVIRVLVLELIPLFAALYVTLRCGDRITQEIGAAVQAGGAKDGADLWRYILVPRLIAGAFSVAPAGGSQRFGGLADCVCQPVWPFAGGSIALPMRWGRFSRLRCCWVFC
ncbi:MAG: ABC transporter permease [Rhodocyclaceae bacterium]|nr:ABC transporter permease [Rhodocyclaceae bacterium]